ncbi:MAG: hypothetical protein Q8S73_25900 [Deltaproteobacteria bacterium]|nr:hypothetical protein [Myxococcales bacterium]MDP3217571.1 hypothetical protein [Deltaproteobacteria bacterium]
MLNPDWKKLTPQIPVGALSDQYVSRPMEGGLRIAERMKAGCTTALIAGPAGIGKSTELLLVGVGLAPEAAVIVPLELDRKFNMRRLDPAEVMQVTALTAAEMALTGGVPLSASLMNRVRRSSAGEQPTFQPELAVLVVREIQRLAPDRPVTLLIDGMEKTPADVARPVFEALTSLGADVNLVVVVSWQLTFGPDAQEVIRPGEKLFVLHPIVVEGEEGAEGRRFFREILRRRLALPEDFFDAATGELTLAVGVIEEAIHLSGGVPRTFLQLVADAGAYAHVRRGSAWPDSADLANAVADQRDSLRRLLIPGDEKALRAVEGTDGREMELERKLRLLSHGIVLEHGGASGPVMRAHPLAQGLL